MPLEIQSLFLPGGIRLCTNGIAYTGYCQGWTRTGRKCWRSATRACQRTPDLALCSVHADQEADHWADRNRWTLTTPSVLHAETREGAYADWILRVACGPLTGQCGVLTLAMHTAFPELQRVRGHAHLLGEEDPSHPEGYAHWWLVTEAGEVVDPTAEQFGGPVTYVPWEEGRREPTGKCSHCGAYCYGYTLCCTEACAEAYAAACHRPQAGGELIWAYTREGALMDVDCCDECGEELPWPEGPVADGTVATCPDCGLCYTFYADSEGFGLSDPWRPTEETP